MAEGYLEMFGHGKATEIQQQCSSEQKTQQQQKLHQKSGEKGTAAGTWEVYPAVELRVLLILSDQQQEQSDRALVYWCGNRVDFEAQTTSATINTI